MESSGVNIPLDVDEIPSEQFSSIKNEIHERLASIMQDSTPLFKHNLTKEEWEQVEEYAAKLNAHYKQRAELMLKRLDVTVDSFLWSDRTKQMEEKLLDQYTPARNSLACPQPVEMDDLLSANSDLLFIDEASSRQVRQMTCNQFNAYKVNDCPNDRGGRTMDMVAPPPDVPYCQRQQQQQQHNQRRQQGDNRRQWNNGGQNWKKRHN